jgi:adenylosuccinate synthase
MSATVIIGSQWGDEGKGKIIDFLSSSAQHIVRFHGGNNAGHTVVNSYGTFPMHLVPSGIFAPKATCYVTNGVVIDIEVLVKEIDMLTNAGVKLLDRFFISPRCHMILPYHKVLDKLYEQHKGKAKTGTTGRGIGPAYADKVSYNGIRLSDFMDQERFSEKLFVQLSIKNAIIHALGGNRINQKEIEHTLSPLRKRMKSFMKEPYPLLQTALQKNEHILLEGAHAVFLDNDWGTYPYVSASTVLAGGSNAAAGIPPKEITKTIGVVKAYTTRVGEGPFPTELFDKTGEKLRQNGYEFGTTTGRPRRCGWFDAELIRFASEVNGFTAIALTKLDVLDTLSEINICTGYTYHGKKVHYYDGDDVFLQNIKPIYKTMQGWKQSLRGITHYHDLPMNAKKYIKELEQQIGVKIQYISTGKKREDIIVR